MCKFDKKNGGRRIDPCMIKLITNLNYIFKSIKKAEYKVVACCCGHGKYPPSIIIQWGIVDYFVELFSSKSIKRKKRFYKKDKQGYYYIPEVSNQP